MGKAQQNNDNDIVVLNKIQNNDIDNVEEVESYMTIHNIRRGDESEQ